MNDGRVQAFRFISYVPFSLFFMFRVKTIKYKFVIIKIENVENGARHTQTHPFFGQRHVYVMCMSASKDTS